MFLIFVLKYHENHKQSRIIYHFSYNFYRKSLLQWDWKKEWKTTVHAPY